MARISYSRDSTSQLTALIADLNSGANYTTMELYLYNSYGTKISTRAVTKSYTGSTVSNSTTWTGLTEGASYTIGFYITTGLNNGSGETNLTMPSRPSTPSVSVSNSSAYGKINASWNSYSPEGISSYTVTVREDNSNGNFVKSFTSYYQSEEIQLEVGKTYVVGVSANNSWGSSEFGWSSSIYLSIPPSPSKPTGVNAFPSQVYSGRATVSWDQSSNTDYYNVRAVDENNNVVVTKNTVYQLSTELTGLTQFTNYKFHVQAVNSYTSSSWTSTTDFVRTWEFTSPTISNLTGDGDGKMSISFNATDGQSGMRSSNTYYTEISSKDGNTYGQGTWQTVTYRTFTVDASGYEFADGSWYYMRVTAYDDYGNYIQQSIRIQYKKSRPDNFEWFVAKTSGQPVVVNANEWNEFCNRINAFRLYKLGQGYSISFTVVEKGVTTITSAIVNQAINAINTAGMSPTKSPPPLTQAGVTTITAKFFIDLKESLNSIV